MKTVPLYSDGWFEGEKELTVIPRPLYPFKMSPLPDIFSKMYERDYAIFPPLFRPRIADRTSWTNALTYSEDLTNAAWTKTNATATANQLTAPDGEDTMSKLVETTANAEHAVSRTVSATATAFEASVFAKVGLTRRFLRIVFTDFAATTFSAVFDVEAGVAMTVAGGATAKIVSMGHGTFRCVMKFTPAAGSGTFKINIGSDASTFSYAGSTSNGLYLWGAQLSAGNEAPYISTTSAARTMSAPMRDTGDPLAFLIQEQDPIPVSSEQGITRRVFSRVPRVQEVPSSLFVTKPSIAGPFPAVLGESLVFQSETNSLQFQFFSRKVVSADSGPQTTFYPSGGTYTLTFAGATTGAIAYNASAATVQTALNALTPIADRGGVTVTGSYNSAGGFTVAFGSYTALTADTTNLVATYGSKFSSVQVSDQGFNQFLSIYASGVGDNASIASSLTPQNANPIEFVSQRFASNFSFYVGNIYTNNYAVSGVTGGSFTLTVFGQTTSAINWDPAWQFDAPPDGSTTTPGAIAIAAALNALSNVIAKGAYVVTQYGPGSGGGIQRFQCVLTTPAFSSGTFTLTAFGQTTGNIAYNATAADIATALNALSNVTARGGCTVTKYTGLQFTVLFPYQAILTAANSLTPSNSTINVTTGNVYNTSQAIRFTSATAERVLSFATEHGILPGDTIFLQADGDYITGITGFSVPSPFSLSFAVIPGGIYQTVAAFISAGKPTSTYTAGLTLTRVKRVSEFFLPGVTPGVNTADDIPLPAYQGDDISLLNAIFDGSTEINYQVGELEQWRDSPILVRTVTKLNPQTL